MTRARDKIKREIVVNEYSENGRIRYNAYTMIISNDNYLYQRRHFAHHHFSLEDIAIIVRSNLRISLGQAQGLVELYLQGKFKQEDTGDWD